MHHSGVHNAASIIEAVGLGKVLCQGVPVAGCDVRRNAFSYSIFDPHRWEAESFEPRDRGVEVRLVE